MKGNAATCASAEVTKVAWLLATYARSHLGPLPFATWLGIFKPGGSGKSDSPRTTHPTNTDHFILTHPMSNTIRAHIGREHYRVEICTSSHTFIADEPERNGGGGRGFTPHELLAAALGGCTNITLRMYADRKQWPLEAVDTQVEVEHGETFDTTHIKRTIRLTGPLSGEQRERLLQIAGRCPIHRTLAGQTDIRTELLPD